jgi:hypothetical protein
MDMTYATRSRRASKFPHEEGVILGVFEAS